MLHNSSGDDVGPRHMDKSVGDTYGIMDGWYSSIRMSSPCTPKSWLNNWITLLASLLTYCSHILKSFFLSKQMAYNWLMTGIWWIIDGSSLSLIDGWLTMNHYIPWHCSLILRFLNGWLMVKITTAVSSMTSFSLRINLRRAQHHHSWIWPEPSLGMDHINGLTHHEPLI